MVVLEIKVIPSAGRQEFLLKDNILRCYILSSPEKGKANYEIFKIMANKLKIHSSSFVIISGATTRNKMIKIATKLSKEEVIKLLLS